MEIKNLTLLKNYLKETFQITVNEPELDVELKKINIEALKSSIKARIKIVEWKGEPINGVDMLNHPNPTIREQLRKTVGEGGKAYKIYIDNQLVVFQYYAPFEQGLKKLTDQNLIQQISLHIDHLTTNLAMCEGLRTLINQLKERRKHV